MHEWAGADYDCDDEDDFPLEQLHEWAGADYDCDDEDDDDEGLACFDDAQVGDTVADGVLSAPPPVSDLAPSFAGARLAATMRSPDDVKRVRALIDDLQLGREVEAAFLLLNVASFRELLEGEVAFRRRLQGLPDMAARIEWARWLINVTDNEVSSLLEEGMEILARSSLA